MDRVDIEILRRLPLFVGLSEERFNDFLACATTRLYHKGHLMFQQGDPADCFFIVLSGWVKIFRVTPDGEESVIRLFTRGESFAEAVMFMGGRYPVSAEVVEDARLVRMSSQPFLRCLHDDPEIGINMLASMSRHLHYLIGQVERLQVRSGTQRVADFLLKLCPVGEGSVVVSLPYDKSLIASRLGMKPESFSRALARLRQLGVRTERNHVSVSDVAALSEYCKGSLQLGISRSILKG